MLCAVEKAGQKSDTGYFYEYVTNREVLLKYRTRACVICVFTGPGGHDVNSDGSCNGNDVSPIPARAILSCKLQDTGQCHLNLLYTVHCKTPLQSLQNGCYLYNTLTIFTT